ncbi:hypothetical protein EL22_28100 [Halostagnicola sp. A56]|uniref:hypothetical protein n=1 Tax=Halostagnicola sp. A56 TaxID=1495067 RepID=UPI00065F69F9|nr:hypothetical protein [Halostagnicola sp. A56]KMT45732.1 hypothetical protein EL22_28100 [Halostagnicola sp. A56]
MKRRTALEGIGIALAPSIAGCLDRVPGIGLDTEFEEVKAELRVEDPPDVTVDGDTVIVRGTVQYGSSSCGTVELAHAAYEDSQDRLDLLIVAADDSNWLGGCTDDLVETGYRVETTTNDDLRRVAVTEHHVSGAAYSTIVDLTN